MQRDTAIGVNTLDGDDFTIGSVATGSQSPVSFALELVAMRQLDASGPTDSDATKFLLPHELQPLADFH